MFPCGHPQVKLAYQESEIVALLKKIPLGTNEMNTIRGRAEELREGTLCDYRPVLPLMLASFIFDVLCTPGTVPIGLCAQGAPNLGDQKRLSDQICTCFTMVAALLTVPPVRCQG